MPAPVLLIVGLLCRGYDTLAEVAAEVEHRLGPVCSKSASYQWTLSRYYESEMGAPLFRQFLALDRLVAPERLPQVKADTMRLELELSTVAPDGSARRRANIDPGYVDAGKLVLASRKSAVHRIYLGEGVFAEVTLMFRYGRFRPLATTYRDYGEPRAIAFFGEVRRYYLGKLRNLA